MTCEDQTFVVDVVVTYPIEEMVATNVISWPIAAIAKFSTIVKICKYRGLHKGHHFIPMAMEMHDAPKHDIDHFIKERAHLFHDRWLEDHLSLYFCIQFFRLRVNIALQHALACTIKRKITLVGYVYSKPPIII
jgi:hypothetical protein